MNFVESLTEKMRENGSSFSFDEGVAAGSRYRFFKYWAGTTTLRSVSFWKLDFRSKVVVMKQLFRYLQGKTPRA